MSDPQAEHDELQRRIEDLRGFEREYRARLRAYLYGLLADLGRSGGTCARHGWVDCEDITCREIAGAVAAERERVAAMAEQDAAHADLQVASEEARIVGEVLRNFAKRLREG